MDEVVLSDGSVKVSIRATDNGVILSIVGDDELRFPLRKSNLAAILDGETIQFSHRGIFCKLTRQDDLIRVVYAWHGRHDSSTCTVSDIEQLLGGLLAN